MPRQVQATGLLCAGFIGAAIAISGCAGESRRVSEGTSTPAGRNTAGSTASGWTRLPVKRVDLKRADAGYLLEAQAAVPSGDWKIEIRPLPATNPTAKEFEVVGLAPTSARAGGTPTIVTASVVIDIDAKVEQVAVYGEDDATLLSPPVR